MKHLITESTKLDKAMKVITQDYNGEIKRKGLRKLGYTKEEIKMIELVYKRSLKDFARKMGDFDDITNEPHNFAGIGYGGMMYRPSSEIKSHLSRDLKTVLR